MSVKNKDTKSTKRNKKETVSYGTRSTKKAFSHVSFDASYVGDHVVNGVQLVGRNSLNTATPLRIVRSERPKINSVLTEAQKYSTNLSVGSIVQGKKMSRTLENPVFISLEEMDEAKREIIDARSKIGIINSIKNEGTKATIEKNLERFKDYILQFEEAGNDILNEELENLGSRLITSSPAFS